LLPSTPRFVTSHGLRWILCLGSKNESKQEFLALIKLEKNVKRKREERNEVH